MVGLDIRRPTTKLVPGHAMSVTGLIGPNRLDRPIQLVLTGKLSPELRYRDVLVSAGAECAVRTRAFACAFALAPGRSAEVRILLVAQALNPSATAIQRLSVASSAGAGSEVTSTLEFDQPGADAEWSSAEGYSSLADRFVILLALLMFALAARGTERRLHRPGE